MKLAIEMGTATGGVPAALDLEELLATRLLVQGNSGSGKSHLLRRLVEQSAAWVQQIIIDPEGDFVTLAERFGHVVVDAADHTEGTLQGIAGRVRQHRVSVVLNLEGLDTEAQMRAAAAFLGGLFDAGRDCWYPVLVVVDEAQLFAPAAAGEVSDEARKLSLGAMTNLMCRGRKRGLAGVIATQRLAKLAKNVAAEASNFLMGRTFLDIDMARAADLLGMERRQAESFRDLERGHFVALGPALSRRPLPIRIGAVETSARSGSPRLLPLPETPVEDARGLILTSTGPALPPPPPPRRAPPSTAEVMAQLARVRPAILLASETAACADGDEVDAPPAGPPPDPGPQIDGVMEEVLADPDAAFRSVAVLYQDFLVRCRIRRVAGPPLDLPAFRRRLAAARAGVDAAATAQVPDWEQVQAIAAGLSDDIQGVYLMIARAALNGDPCPSDHEVARACGSRSAGRARRLLTYMEQRGHIVCRAGRDGRRSIALPGLAWETAFGDPNAHASNGDTPNGRAEADGAAAG